MSLASFIESKKWKTIQNYIYSWGASIVLIGALFKLQHLQYSGILLGVGLSIEAIIFFISAFEPLMEQPDWKRIYPQLRTGNEKPEELDFYSGLDEKYFSVVKGGGNSNSALADLSDDQIAILNESLTKISNTVKGIKDISEVATATNGFVENLNQANASITNIIESNKKASSSFNSGLEEISSNYKEASTSIKGTSEEVAGKLMVSLGEMANSNEEAIQKIKESGIKSATDIENIAELLTQDIKTSVQQLVSSYDKVNSSLDSNLGGLGENTSQVKESIESMNKNLAALNILYQSQIKNAEETKKSVSEYNKGVESIGKLLAASVDETEKLNKNTQTFNQNIEALNNVYGNMLGALNIKK